MASIPPPLSVVVLWQLWGKEVQSREILGDLGVGWEGEYGVAVQGFYHHVGRYAFRGRGEQPRMINKGDFTKLPYMLYG